jgi:hypothetical protein
MTRRTAPLAALLVLSLCAVAGCASDSPVAVAEKSVTTSFHATRAFLEFDNAHRAELVAKAPAVHAVAEAIRPQARVVFPVAWGSIQLYKQTRADADKATMMEKVADAQWIGDQANGAAGQAKMAGVGGTTTP